VATTTALTLGAQVARAADAAGTVSELVVTGGLEESVPSQLAQYGSRMDVVSSRQIELLNLSDVGGILSKAVPGLYFAPQNGPFSYNFASIQGSRQNEILYLFDGVRISNRLYNTTPPLDTIPAHMVDHIEVLDGGQGLFFGTSAVAGVINIVSRPFTDTTTGRLAIGGDTNDSVSANGYVSGAVGGSKIVA